MRVVGPPGGGFGTARDRAGQDGRVALPFHAGQVQCLQEGPEGSPAVRVGSSEPFSATSGASLGR
jgi:hypothetical protein